jgi:hypothetical protein
MGLRIQNAGAVYSITCDLVFAAGHLPFKISSGLTKAIAPNQAYCLPDSRYSCCSKTATDRFGKPVKVVNIGSGSMLPGSRTKNRLHGIPGTA